MLRTFFQVIERGQKDDIVHETVHLFRKAFRNGRELIRGMISRRVLSGTQMEKLVKNNASCFIGMKAAELLLPVHRIQTHD